MDDIIVTGNDAYFNKDVYIYGRLYCEGVTGSLTNVTITQIGYGNCANPIIVTGGNSIDIGPTSNAYGTRYISETQPISSCDGDIWYDTSNSGGSVNIKDAGVWKVVSGGGQGISGDSYWKKTEAGISTSSNIGIKTETPTSALHIIGDALVSGVVTATTFYGDGVVSGVVTATTFYGDGSNLTGIPKSRINISGITSSIANNGIGYTTLAGFKSYGVFKVGLSTAGWLRIYTDANSRTSDVGRSYWQDPNPGDGVILDVVTTGIQTSFKTSPFVFGYNNDTPPSNNLYIAITNFSGITTSISVNLTLIQIEE